MKKLHMGNGKGGTNTHTHTHLIYPESLKRISLSSYVPHPLPNFFFFLSTCLPYHLPHIPKSVLLQVADLFYT